MAEKNPASQRQTAVTAFLKSKQLLLFVFARRSVCQYSMAEENPAKLAADLQGTEGVLGFEFDHASNDGRGM